MKRYKIYHSSLFDEKIGNFDAEFARRVDKIEDQLIENPYQGDPLNVKWFREKRIDEKRVYFIIYEDLDAVFMVAVSGKKDQQRVINTVRLLLDSFRNEIENLISKDDLDFS